MVKAITNVKKQKAEQRRYYNNTYAFYFRKGWKNQTPDSLIDYFVESYPLNRAIDMLPFRIRNLKVLCICCGDGFEGEFLHRLGAEVTVSDISEEGVKAAKRRCKYLKGFVADSENLPFEDGKFDLVLVRNGLHHLPHPIKGIHEMNRVSKKGFIIIEAQKNFVTWFLIKIGFAEEYEVTGNFVYRFTRKEIRRLMEEIGVTKYKIKTFWCRYVYVLSKYMYPNINNKMFLGIYRFLFEAFNLVFGYLGNSIVVVSLKGNDVNV